MTIDPKLKAIIDGFEFEGELIDCAEIKAGHINVTYRVTFGLPNGDSRDYVLQRINTYVFRKPDQVMENVRLVTEHLRDAMRARGEDPENRVLRVVPVKGGGILLLDEDGGSWRAYDYILHASTVDQVSSPAQFETIGGAFGSFQSMLADFPIDRLYDTIPDFHDTKKRLDTFERSVAMDVKRRAASVGPEIAFVRARRDAMGEIVNLIESGELPLRVTHNDTKINNVMLDDATGEAVCVIDLDTVMAGSALYDFGDAIRYGASTAAEDEADLDRIALNLDLFRAFAEGFIRQTARGLTEAELRRLPLGAMVMTFENGLRFLTDYLDGDVYFKIDRPDHNLIRARAQFKLLTDMEAHRADMQGIVDGLIERYR